MELPDLSLRSTFSPPHYKDHKPPPPKCTMCRFTIYNFECGHAAEDHAETGSCPHFEKTGLSCDRENLANRNRVTVKSEDWDGLCNKCRRRQQELSEMEAMSREEERAKQQSLAEAMEREAKAKEHEERLLEESREEFARLQREREQADIEYMLQKSREEAEAARELREQEELARALKASCVLGPADRNVTVDKKVRLLLSYETWDELMWLR
jgi:enabled protein